MRPTIKDVARLAGVSPATVSHALSGKRSVHSATVARVQDAIAQLGYRPNPIASSMITGRTSTIGLLVPDISNPFFGQLVAAIEQTAGTRGFAALVASSELEPELEASHVEALVDRQVDALIYAGGTPRPNPAILDRPGALPPIVFIDEAFEWIPEGAGIVSVDNEQGGRIAAEHLLELGHRAVLAITGPVGLPTAHSRVEAFQDAFTTAPGAGSAEEFDRDRAERDRAESIRVRVTHADAYTIEAGYRVAKAALEGRQAEGTNAPTALYCTNDLLACGALRALRDLGLRVPADISVISFDNTFVCELTNPTLTSISQPLIEMGRRAVNTAIDLISGADPPETPRGSAAAGQAESTSNSGTEQQLTALLAVSLAVRESTSRFAPQPA